MNGPETTFERDFWALYEPDLRQHLERACSAHLRRVGGPVDPDDMVSWAAQRVWKMLRDRPNQIIEDGVTAEQAAERVKTAAPLLARWAYLAHIRKEARHAERERASEDLEAVRRLSAVRAEPGAFERKQGVADALAAVRARASAQLRGRLAATWPAADERARIQSALDAQRDEDDDLRDRVNSGDLKENTVHQMRSRSLKAARDLFRDAGRFLPLIAVAAFVAAAFAGSAMANDDDGGEQTGGKSKHVAQR
ncbi:MAG: hypothetical protein AAGF47_00250 [Planctomycetota bacterium]